MLLLDAMEEHPIGICCCCTGCFQSELFGFEKKLGLGPGFPVFRLGPMDMGFAVQYGLHVTGGGYPPTLPSPLEICLTIPNVALVWINVAESFFRVRVVSGLLSGAGR